MPELVAHIENIVHEKFTEENDDSKRKKCIERFTAALEDQGQQFELRKKLMHNPDLTWEEVREWIENNKNKING